MEGLDYLSLGSEEDYYDEFKKIYKEEIKTPDGFSVICKDIEKAAKHTCGGKRHIFQRSRANRIKWPRYILLNPAERIILRDTKTNNLIFFFEKRKTKYAVICSQIRENELIFISGFIVKGERAQKYKKGAPPYEFYTKKSC